MLVVFVKCASHVHAACVWDAHNVIIMCKHMHLYAVCIWNVCGVHA
jgi:hypothetical protein